MVPSTALLLSKNDRVVFAKLICQKVDVIACPVIDESDVPIRVF